MLLLGAILAPNSAAARCIPVAERWQTPHRSFVAGIPNFPARLQNAAATSGTARGPALPEDTVELTFLGHSTFLIRTAANATAVTDYNGYIRAPFAPDIVTMNRAHNTHYTDVIEPGVKHALRGWMEKGVIPSHNVTVRDLHVTNVATNIREAVGDSGWAGNSIFIFKSAGMCIAHLGHLHHRLKPSHAARVGMIDVLLAPIDDGFTMPHTLLVKVIDDLNPTVVVPMHYGFGGTLESFLAQMRSRKFAIRIAKSRSTRFTKATLPRAPTVLVLQGGGI
ncbi:MAG: MBL fold metallo-hydrolase [Alphaproteobacteria bacterium]|nr:MBL fold metallo-hydrolase [Alphaproteobacteria bacterium]